MITHLINEYRQNGIVHFIVKAKPNASQTRLIEVMDDNSLKIAIGAPAEKGKANTELLKFLSKEFCVSKKHVRLVAGATTRTKIIEIRNS